MSLSLSCSSFFLFLRFTFVDSLLLLIGALCGGRAYFFNLFAYLNTAELGDSLRRERILQIGNVLRKLTEVSLSTVVRYASLLCLLLFVKIFRLNKLI